MGRNLYIRIRLEAFGLGVVLAPRLRRLHVFVAFVHIEIGLDY